MRRLRSFGRAIKNRRAATVLAGLDDRMLADIGITRSDLRDAYSEPLWHDPTDVLVGRAARTPHAPTLGPRAVGYRIRNRHGCAVQTATCG